MKAIIVGGYLHERLANGWVRLVHPDGTEHHFGPKEWTLIVMTMGPGLATQTVLAPT